MEQSRNSLYRSQRFSYASLFHITILLLFSAVQCLTAQSDGIPPKITPDQADITVLPSENLEFKCQSTEPIHWQFHDEFLAYDPTYEIQDSQTSEYPFESVLKISHVDYSLVGYFYCVKNSTENLENQLRAEDNPIEDELELDTRHKMESLMKIGQANSIYLFVEDPQHPLAPVNLPFVEGVQFREVLIPCKPTSKKWEVQLIKDGDERHQFESKFSPTDGYLVLLNEQTDAGAYACHAKIDATGEHDIHFNVHIKPGESFIQKPTIESKTYNYGVEHQQLELTCRAEADFATKLSMMWVLPNNDIAQWEGRAKIEGPFSEGHKTNSARYFAVGTLTVSNLDKTKDVGTYTCIVADSSSDRKLSNFLDVTQILGENEAFIDISEPSKRYSLVIDSNSKEAKWYVKYSGYPDTTIVWKDPQNNTVPWAMNVDNTRINCSEQDTKIEATREKQSTTLKIKCPKIANSGTYTLYAKNIGIQKKQTFQLFVKTAPKLNMSNITVKPNENAVAVCHIFGYPTSMIIWSFIPCDKFEFETCDESKAMNFTKETYETVQKTTFNQTSTLIFQPNGTGIIICRAKNGKGNTEARAHVVVSDLDEELTIWSENELPLSVGDDVSLICGASAHKYATELNWFKDGVIVQSGNDVQVISHNTPYSHRKELHWNPITHTATGKYMCQANVVRDDSFENRMYDLEIVEPVKPYAENSNVENGKILKHVLGEPLQMRCKFAGIPRPTITWYKDDDKISPDSNDTRMTLKENNTLLDILFIKGEDEGKYKCVASNRIATVTRETTLKITNLQPINKGLIFGVVAVILLLLICTVYLCLRIRRERRLFKELKAAGLANFEEGNPESINPDLALDEQADLLPYDKKYEFPRDKLKLGKQLGAGAFGIVIKGFAQGIVPHEEQTTVAVKMVKKMADNEVMRALISELKIMVHLGQHLNVVNLLGAVTKNIAQREVMVIVEYCKFGNLQNFLKEHRKYFIDQINREKDIIDPSIMTRDLRWSSDSGFSYLNRPESDRQSVVNSAYIRHTNAGDYFPGGMDSANTEATLLSRNTQPGGEDNPALSNNSQPAWRSNYQSDYKGPRRSVTTTDLLIWSFQVARGMEYLSSRKVLHGDLAARNILLCDDNVVKICDFGLARSMYKTDNYRKKGEAPLPFKWLAIESISDQVFSTYSDVWSFGIVLWELFSLGKVPYPGMDADQALYFKLKDGYRMEKPEYATQDIYDIMLSCWGANPESRPLFDALENSISKLLENGVADLYIDLNEPYLKSNVSNFNSGQTDYLALMGPPECQAPLTPCPPNYVNSHVIAMQPPNTSVSQPNYLAMASPSDINSPMPDGSDTHDSHFPFTSINSPTIANNLNASDSSPKLRTKITNIPEEIPMLKRSNQSIQSDSDSELNVSDEFKSDSLAQKNANMLNTTIDNYVNVPSAKINTNKDAVSNPGYIVVSNVNETRT